MYGLKQSRFSRFNISVRNMYIANVRPIICYLSSIRNDVILIVYEKEIHILTAMNLKEYLGYLKYSLGSKVCQSKTVISSLLTSMFMIYPGTGISNVTQLS